MGEDAFETEAANATDAAASSKDPAQLYAHPRVHARRATIERDAPQRIVSLVPSLSEALVVLGLGERLVGVTEYCVHPPGAFDALPKVGGTKDADVDAILATQPDLVIANQEENTARVVRQLAARGVDVWVTYPRTVSEGAALLAELATLGASRDAQARFVAPCLEAVASASRAGAAATTPPPRVFCPIWRDPWMAVGPDTYIHDMITLCGGRNVFGAEASSADVSDRRYPIVSLETVLAHAPEVILLPDEPYAFGPADAEALRATDCPAARSGRIHLIDGSLVSWYGPRIAEAIQVLGRLFCDSPSRQASQT